MSVDEETKKRHKEISESKKDLKCMGYFFTCILITILLIAIIM
jgi:hypothetical protein